MITDDLADPVYYERIVRRAEWLREAGRSGEALTLLEGLQAEADAGDRVVFAQDLDKRVAVAKALGN